MLNENYRLVNGVEVPKIALGTWQISDEEVERVVEDALDIGYRHIDTAYGYGNEKGIGRAIKKSKINREQLFITTKIPAECKNYEEAKKCILESLKNLDTTYIDLLLIHAPKPWAEVFSQSDKMYFKENLEVWKAMEEVYKKGNVRAIGVSNFDRIDIDNIINNSEIQPQVNQIRVHIGHTPKDVIEYCEKNMILIQAFSPNATGKLAGHPVISKIAEKYQVSIPQLSIRYNLQLGTLPLPKTTKKVHMIENANVNFVITKEDVVLLSQIEEIESL